MSKLLELDFAHSKISGTVGGTEYTVINSSDVDVSTSYDPVLKENTLELGTISAGGVSINVDTTQYGSVDLNSFHDTNRAFTIEFSLSDNSPETSKPYNYVAIGKKTYSTMHDVITIGKNETGDIVLGVMSHKESFKTVPLSLPDGARFPKGPKYEFQFNYDPNQAIEKRATLYVTNDRGEQYLVAELGTVFNDRMVNILDFVLYIGTSGTTNEIGYENKLDLTTGVTFHDKIKVYSGTTMDKETTYFYHSGFSNLAHSVADVCNNKADEVIFTKFKTDNDLVEGSDLTVKLTNPHDNAYENVGEYFSKDNDTLEFAFKFSNLEKVTTTNTFLGYEVSYLNKDFTITPTINTMYIDSVTPSLVYNITDIGSDYVEFKIDSISDGDFRTHTSQSDYANYNVTFKAVNPNTNAEITKSVDNPLLFSTNSTTYRITGLDDGIYYNVSAVITDPAKNASAATVPATVNSGLRRHYTNTSIRTTDITAPTPFTVAQASSSGTGFSFDVTGISDNATVNTANPLDLFYLLSATKHTDDATLKSDVENNGTKQTFTTATSSFNIPQTDKLTNNDPVEADKNYYFYAILKDADDNITIGKNSSNDKFVQFKVENSLTFTSMVSDYSINTLASEANNLTIKFTTAYPVLVSSDFSMIVNGKDISTPTIAADDATNKNWTITYSLSVDNGNASHHGYVTGSVKLSITSTDGAVVNRTVDLSNTAVMLRGKDVTRNTGPYTNVFTNLQPNSISTNNHLNPPDQNGNTFGLKANDKIIDKSGLKKYDVKLYEKNGDLNPIQEQNFSAFDDIPAYITFENLTEGKTYYVSAEVTNNLDQSYIIGLQNDITTTSVDPITSTALSTSDAKMNDKPSIEITGFAVNDVNSSYDVYIAALQSNIPASLTSDDIKTFFDGATNTKRFADVSQNTVTNIVTSKGSMTNGDGVFDVSGNPKIVKAYDYSSKAVSDIAKDTTKLVLIAMVRDKSVDNNFITFHKTHNFSYDVYSLAFTNVKNTSSKFVTTGDVVNMTFTTNYAVNAARLSSTFYGATQTFTTSDDGVNWTVGLTLPGSAPDESLIKNNTTLLINVDASRTKTLTTDIQVDKTAPVWSFGTVTSTSDSNINAQVTLTSDVASAEPMHFVLEASNDGSTATAADAGKTLVTTDTFLTFGSPSTQSVALNGLSPGLDYFIKGQLYDANSNLTEISFVNPGVNKGVVFTTDSILPTVEVEPNVYPSLEDVRVQGLQVKDNNSIYGYVAAITEPTNSFTYTEYKSMNGESKDVFLKEAIARGTADTLDSRTFTKYIKTDKTEGAIQNGTPYKLVVIIKDVSGSVKTYEKSFTTDYPVVLSDTVDTSGAGGGLTHLFNYDLNSLTNSLGSPHGLVSGNGNVTYVDGFVGSNAVFLNSNVSDDHSIKVSSESMSNHTEFSFATWLKSYNDTDTSLKTLFYYDDDHYLRIKDSQIQSKWGVAATLDIPTMEYTNTDWNHIVMTANSTDTTSATDNVTIYWNGSNIDAGGASITHVPNNKTEFYIGGEPTGSTSSTSSSYTYVLSPTKYEDTSTTPYASFLEVVLYDETDQKVTYSVTSTMSGENSTILASIKDDNLTTAFFNSGANLPTVGNALFTFTTSTKIAKIRSSSYNPQQIEIAMTENGTPMTVSRITNIPATSGNNVWTREWSLTSGSGGGNFKGILDDTRIYDSIITSEDVGLLYGAGGNALEITFDSTGNLVFSNDSGTLSEAQITELLDTTDTATGEASITFDGDTTLELSGSQLDGIETTTDGVLTESTVSFWIKPTDDTFAQENVIMEYFATIGYSVTILPNGTLQFDVVDNSTSSVTKSENLVFRSTFDSDIYINTDLSGSLSVANNFVTSNTTSVNGTSSGYKNSISTTFRISNFISSPYTVTFWMKSQFTGTFGEQWQAILAPDLYWAKKSWRMYFYPNTGEIGVYSYIHDQTGGSGWNGTGINHTHVYNRWVMISISSSGRVSVKGTSTTDYDGTLISSGANYNTSGDNFEFGGTEDTTVYDINDIYFDDIRVYNTELTSAELTDVYNEITL